MTPAADPRTADAGIEQKGARRKQARASTTQIRDHSCQPSRASCRVGVGFRTRRSDTRTHPRTHPPTKDSRMLRKKGSIFERTQPEALRGIAKPSARVQEQYHSGTQLYLRRWHVVVARRPNDYECAGGALLLCSTVVQHSSNSLASCLSISLDKSQTVQSGGSSVVLSPSRVLT